MLALVLTLFPAAVAACDQPVCVVQAETLKLTAIIDFEDVSSSLGIGRPIEGILQRPGASFGERFRGQTNLPDGNYDRIDGAPGRPLALEAGPSGQNLGAMRLPGTNVLHGHGPRGYPRSEAVGEGSIAVLFDRDQPALALDIRGGEGGHATIQFFRRDGSAIVRLTLGPLKEDRFGFVRAGLEPDIAGLLIQNDDPEGIAIDNLSFDADELMG